MQVEATDQRPPLGGAFSVRLGLEYRWADRVSVVRARPASVRSAAGRTRFGGCFLGSAHLSWSEHLPLPASWRHRFVRDGGGWLCWGGWVMRPFVPNQSMQRTASKRDWLAALETVCPAVADLLRWAKERA